MAPPFRSRFEALEERLVGWQAVPAAPRTPAPVLGLPIGTRAPGFRLSELLGQVITLDDLTAAGKPVLLFFTNPNCGPCQALMPDIARWQRDHTAALTIAVVTEGTVEENRVKSAQAGISQVLFQQKREIAEIYQAWGTPAAVLIQADGTIASPVAQGADAVRAVVTQAIGATRSRPAPSPAASARRSTPAVIVQHLVSGRLTNADEGAIAS